MSNRRRDFELTEVDRDFVTNRQFDYEAVLEGGIRRLIIYDYPVPAGYSVAKVTLNLRFEAGYPDTAIDMVYFLPALQRSDGKPIAAIADDAFDGKVWQRWSRHRTGDGPWRPGEDGLETHLLLVDDWLQRELKK